MEHISIPPAASSLDPPKTEGTTVPQRNHAPEYWMIIPAWSDGDHDQREQMSAVLLFSEQGNVAIHPVTASDACSLADVLDDEMIMLGYRGQPVLMALRTEDILSVTIPDDPDRPRNMTDEALLYELEEFVPLPAEQFVADFARYTVDPVPEVVDSDHSARSVESVLSKTPPLHGQLALLVKTDQWKPFLDKMDRIGIPVTLLVSLSELVVRGLTVHMSPEESCAIHALAWSFGTDEPFADRHVEILFCSKDGRPMAWRFVQCDPVEIRRAFEIARLSFPNTQVTAVTCGLSPTQFDAITANKGLCGAKSIKDNHSWPALIYSAGQELLLGKTEPWWNLRKGELAMKSSSRLLQKSVRRLLWCSVLALMSFCLFCGLHIFRLYRMADHYHLGQKEFFYAALPDQNLGTGFRNRLESEYKKMSAQREHLLDMPDRTSVLVPLFHLLRSLPDEPRHQFPEIRLEREQIRLDGQLQTHSDAETIATVLERNGFQVEPPTTRQNPDGGVSVRLVMRWCPKDDKEAEP